jgi:hypothetical protein
MPKCKSCGGDFDWALDEGKWVLLEPIGMDADLAKTFLDENEVLRADHRERHGSATLNVTRLYKKVPADEIEETEEVVAETKRRWYRKATEPEWVGPYG